MNIEEYAKSSPQYYGSELPAILKKYLDTQEVGTLLECGCGDGTILTAMKAQGYFEKLIIKAIDLSSVRIDLVKKIDERMIANVDNVEMISSIEDDSVDFIISTQVIEHVDDIKMVSSMNRVLKKNGIIYLTTVHKKKYGWYFYKNVKGDWALDPTHLREYENDGDLLNIFSSNQYEILENNKTMQFYPIIDFFIKRIGVRKRDIFSNFFMNILRKIKLPIFGYYKWELVLKKI